MSQHLTCDGCGGRIADADAGAARRVPLPTRDPKRSDGLSDWCGCCVGIIYTEVPRLAREAREARRAAAAPLLQPHSVQHRARNLWPIGGIRPPVVHD